MAFRLLVVDDSPAMRLAIRRTMDISGLPVQCILAEHGKAALSILEKNQIDLMLVDLNMPELSGDDLIRCLAQGPEQKRIPFLIMSADATAPRIQEMFDLGAIAYLPKPFSFATLRTEMSKALETLNVHN